MASIVPIVIGCIDYLAYGTIFTRAMFDVSSENKTWCFFPAKKAVDACRPGGGDFPLEVIHHNNIMGFSINFFDLAQKQLNS